MIGIVDDNRKLSLKKINNILVKKTIYFEFLLLKNLIIFLSLFVLRLVRLIKRFTKIITKKNKILFFNYE